MKKIKNAKNEPIVIKMKNGEEFVVTEKKKRYSAATIFFLIAMISLPLINWLIFYVYLNIDGFFLSFFRYKDGNAYFTLENYTMLFKDLASGQSELNEAFKNTFLTFGVNLVQWPFQIALSYFLYKKIRLANTFRIIFYVPSIVCGVVVSSFVLALCGNWGPFVPLVTKIWKLEVPPSSIFTDSTFANMFVLIHMCWIGFPGNLILWGGTLSRIPDSLVEYGRLEGIGWVKEIYMIIIPLIWPTFVLLFIMMWAGLFNAGGAVFLLTGGGGYGTQTLSNWMYMQVYNIQAEKSNAYNYMAAFGLLLSIVASAISLTTRHFANKLNTEVEY